MALLPRDVYRSWWDDMDRYHRELEDHFQHLSLRDNLWCSLPPIPSFKKTIQPWRQAFDRLDQQIGGLTTVERDNDKFRVIVDVQQFAPEEITVRTDDKYITVEGQHQERKDHHGFVTRQFVRRYVLPKGYDMGHVRPSLSTDGVLTITAPRLALPAPGERIVPIERNYGLAIKAL